MTVYIVQDLGRTSLIPAEDYGDLKVCLDRRYSHLAVRRAFSLLRESMRDITREDFLLPIGNPAYIAFAGSIMKEKTGLVRCLSWDNQAQKYFVQEVD